MAKTTLIALMAPSDENKLGGQAKVIVETIIAKVGLNKPIDREDLCKELDAKEDFSAKQSAQRVVGYYQPRLVEKGFISAETEKAEPKAKAAKAGGEKAAPEKAAAGDASGAQAAG